MKKLRVSTREIGAVNVFDLEGVPTDEALQEIADKIQRKIRRHRMQRIIINLQNVPPLDIVCLRKLLAACLRPQRSLIYGANPGTINAMENTYMPTNVHICRSEIDVADDFGPFLLEKDSSKRISLDNPDPTRDTIGKQIERRRSKRMHVAIPVEFSFPQKDQGTVLVSKAIVTNISEGGLFAEYLDLNEAKQFEMLKGVEGLEVDIRLCPCVNFPEEYHLKGIVVRRELRKRQVGLAVRFVDN